MSEDLISRQAAIEALWKEPECIDPLNVMAEARDRIALLPSAQERKGKWIPENRNPRSIMFYCSECHRTAYDMQGAKGTPKRCRYAFCPNCGARMEGGNA